MKPYLVITFILFFFFSCFGQDTSIVKGRKGFLFLSAYNYMYDYKTEEIRNLGFHDFFYPSSNFDIKCLSDSNRNIVFKNGIRVDFFQGRKGIKSRAIPITCVDTSKCYRYENFYVIPVTIDYKVFEDYEPFICRKAYYEIQVANGSNMRFEYLHKAMYVLRIIAPPIPNRK